MLTVKLFVFGKKINSTLQPDLAQGVDFPGQLKEDFSPMHLNITFSMSDPTNAPTYNYAYIASFSNRYYFINEWVFEGGLWVASLTVDVLATYKTMIGNSTQYVSRSETAPASGFSEWLVDSAYPTTGPITRSYWYHSYYSFWGTQVTQGIIVLGIISGGTNNFSNVGSVHYYAMSYYGARKFFAQLLDSPSYMNITDISQDLQKALINPAQYIVSCQWLPVPYSYMANSGNSYVYQIRCGWWDFVIDEEVYVLDDPGADKTFREFEKNFTVYKHTQEARGKYLNASPYSTYLFQCLPFGIFELDSLVMATTDTLVANVRINLMTGDAVLRLRRSTDQTTLYFFVTQCNVGVPIPTGQIAVNLANLDQAIMMGAVVGADTLVSNFRASRTAEQAAAQSAKTSTGAWKAAPGAYSGHSHTGGKF